jgi:metallo-beta-lactamase family protein
MKITFLGAAREVTGSCYLVNSNGRNILLECGLIQGAPADEARNREPFAFDPNAIDVVILSHSHIDHSGRIPLLVKAGYRGPVYTHRASRDLCRIMLKDSGFLNEKDVEWDNRKRQRRGEPLLEPLYTMADAQTAMGQIKGVQYGERKRLFPGCSFRLNDAGHILGSSIVELWLEENGQQRKIVFSGDLGHHGAPILRDPTPIENADLVLMESTYGNRLHRGWQETYDEIGEVLSNSEASRGNVLIPAFAVGRTQELLYLFEKYYKEWGLSKWQVFLDSPMAIQATEVYARHAALYDEEAAELWQRQREQRLLTNLHLTRTANQSMRINRMRSGAIIIAGSGMCTGGRIRHHLKHNVWREHSHIVIVGFQARGTPGRALVDGATHINLWGEKIVVRAAVHTIGGLSAHADQDDLVHWYRKFTDRPPLVLVHGEANAIAGLEARLSA